MIKGDNGIKEPVAEGARKWSGSGAEADRRYVNIFLKIHVFPILQIRQRKNHPHVPIKLPIPGPSPCVFHCLGVDTFACWHAHRTTQASSTISCPLLFVVCLLSFKLSVGFLPACCHLALHAIQRTHHLLMTLLVAWCVAVARLHQLAARLAHFFHRHASSVSGRCISARKLSRRNANRSQTLQLQN
jgi:hypothetical protein